MNIIIIGAAGLIGRSLSSHLIQQHNLILADINLPAVEDLALQLSSNQTTTQSIACDITQKGSINTLIKLSENALGQIDAMINCCYPRGQGYGRSFFDVSYDDFCENTNLHLGGYFLTMQLFAQHFQQQGNGRIINISSIYGVIPPKFDVYKDTGMTMPVEYAAIKSGLIHLTKYTAQLLKGSGVTANCVSPGGILDGQNKNFIQAYNKHCNSKGMMPVSALNGAIDLLLSESGTLMTGQNLVVDDGFSL